MSDSQIPASQPHGVPAPPPDDENPALIDAHQAFIITVVSAALFIGVVTVFILF